MKAAQITKYGGKDVVEVVDNAPKPNLRPTQVLVQAHAASVNPYDVKVRDGAMQEYLSLTLPAILGGDVAGTVAEIGAEVSGFEIGQPVFGLANANSGQGSFAEFTPVVATQLAPKPANLDFVQAAAAPLVGISAYQALVDHMNLQPNQKVLIHGGAGGIGSMAIQLAKHIGAYVATTAAASDADYVRSLGADEVIDYREQDFSKQLKGYDAAFDTVGGETNAKSYQVLKKGGVLVSMVMPPNEELQSRYGVEAISQSSKATPERLAALSELIEAGHLVAQIDKVFPLEQAADAMEHLKTAHPRGKVVIQITD